MGKIADEIKSYFGIAEKNAKSELTHYGTPRHSGRYPWGSGKEPYQHCTDFLSRVKSLEKEGHKETEIAKELGLTTTQLRVQKSLANDEVRKNKVDEARKLRNEGYSLNQIAEIMGFNNDSSVRTLLNDNSEQRMKLSRKTADFLKQQIEEKGMIDVGKGIENHISLENQIGVSPEKLEQAIYLLEREGYPVYKRRVPQHTNPGKYTTLKVICPKGTEYKEIYDSDKIHYINDHYSHDDGDTFDKLKYPASFDSKRLKICYAEDGGKEKDGLVEIRRGVDDISLGDARYSQVRILVDGTHYIKGMAVYRDDMPKGTDIIFNTNKTSDVPKMDVLKKIKDDPDNPFGSYIKPNGQSYYIDKNGDRKLRVINKRADEGDWEDWSKKIPSQFLAKQNKTLIKKQLDLSIADKQAEFEDINALTNPTVKKQQLITFANDCDSSAVHLKAAALPRQRYQVILPIPTLKDNEVYAPNFKNGEEVALIRFPHAGTFEIPICTVNNKHKPAKDVIGNALDAVGINSRVAERLSGADFDGDTVLVVPQSKDKRVKITSTPALEGLKNFDPKLAYPERPGMKYMTKGSTGNEMGQISNLITDMTIKGASSDELARAVRHSMVVIDAEKHKLDYQQSYKDNNIKELKRLYQAHVDDDGKVRYGGATTLLSRAKSPVYIPKRKGTPSIDKETGEYIYKEANERYINKKGKEVLRTQKSTQMFETKDPYTLSTGTPKEEIYAEYAAHLKSLANSARKEYAITKDIKRSPSAAKAYAEEVNSLEKKLFTSESNRPRERRAQVLADSITKSKIAAEPTIKDNEKEYKKIKQQSLELAREKVGAKRIPIEITDKEWEAIQSGAISANKLRAIMNYVKPEKLKELATPRNYRNKLTDAKIARIKTMNASGYSVSEIAEALGISNSTVIEKLKPKQKKELKK